MLHASNNNSASWVCFSPIPLTAIEHKLNTWFQWTDYAIFETRASARKAQIPRTNIWTDKEKENYIPLGIQITYKQTSCITISIHLFFYGGGGLEKGGAHPSHLVNSGSALM